MYDQVVPCMTMGYYGVIYAHAYYGEVKSSALLGALVCAWDWYGAVSRVTLVEDASGITSVGH